MSTTTSAAIAERDNGPEGVLAKYRDDFALVLPSHVSADQFVRLSQSAYRRGTPALRTAAQKNVGSFLAALLDCARYGLEPGDTYHLVPFGNEVVGIRDYSGEIALMYRTGKVSSIKCEVVYENDLWQWKPTQMDRPIHEWPGSTGEPTRAGDVFGKDRGAMVGVYAYAELTDGSTSRVVVLNEAEVMKIKAVSKTAGRADSVWNAWPDRAWRKTAVHQLWRWTPKSAEYLGAIAQASNAMETVRLNHDLPQPTTDEPSYGDDDAADVCGTCFEAPCVCAEDAHQPTGGAAEQDAPPVSASEAASPPVASTAGKEAPVVPTPATGGSAPAPKSWMRGLFAALHENGIGEDQRHEWATEQLGRTVESFTDLSRDDVRLLLDACKPADTPGEGF